MRARLAGTWSGARFEQRREQPLVAIERTEQLVDVLERRRCPQAEVGRVGRGRIRGQRPIDDRDEVAAVDRHAVGDLEPVHSHVDGVDERSGVVLRVARRDRGRLFGLDELAPGEVAHAIEQPVPQLPREGGRLEGLQQRPIGEGAQRIEHIGRRVPADPLEGQHGARCPRIEAPDEHRTLRQRPPRPRLEEVPGSLQHRLQRPPRRRAPQQREAPIEPVDQLPHPQDPRPRRAQLDRQRQPVELAAQRPDLLELPRGRRVARPGAQRPRDEQADGVGAGDLVRIPLLRIGAAQGGDRDAVFFVQLEPAAARDHEPRRRIGEPVRDQRRAGNELLEAVEHHRHSTGRDPPAEARDRLVAGPEPAIHPERPRQRHAQRVRIVRLRHIAPPRVGPREQARRQRRLAHPARTDEHDQAVLVIEGAADRGHLGLLPHVAVRSHPPP